MGQAETIMITDVTTAMHLLLHVMIALVKLGGEVITSCIMCINWG